MIKLYILKEKGGTSKSKEIFTKLSEKMNIEIEYENFSFPKEYFDKVISKLKEDREVMGFNVTMPYKLEILNYIEKSEYAALCGAVNCVSFVGNDRRLIGYNTDWYGIFNPVNERKLEEKRIACIAGAGGAARSAFFALDKAGFEEIHVFNRSLKRLEEFKGEFDKGIVHVIDELDVFLLKHKVALLINTTSMGMIPDSNTCIPVSDEALKNVRIVFDAVYKPFNTVLIRKANKAGCDIIYGLEMLYEQHIENVKIWDIPKKDLAIDVMKEMKKNEINLKMNELKEGRR